jgi:hypothetical protein
MTDVERQWRNKRMPLVVKQLQEISQNILKSEKSLKTNAKIMS